MLRLIKAFDRLFVTTIGFLCVVLFAVMIVSVFGQVVMRYVFSSPLSWSEELARYAMVWLAMLAAALCSRHSQHIALTGFGLLAGRVLSIVRGAAALFVCALLAILLWHSWDLAGRAFRQTTPGLGLSMSWIYACLPVGFGLMIVGQILGLLAPTQASPHSGQTTDVPGIGVTRE